MKTNEFTIVPSIYCETLKFNCSPEGCDYIHRFCESCYEKPSSINAQEANIHLQWFILSDLNSNWTNLGVDIFDHISAADSWTLFISSHSLGASWSHPVSHIPFRRTANRWWSCSVRINDEKCKIITATWCPSVAWTKFEPLLLRHSEVVVYWFPSGVRICGGRCDYCRSWHWL